MPRLSGIDQIPAGRNCEGESRQRAGYHAVVWEKLVEAGDDTKRRLRLDCGQAMLIERVALHELHDAIKTLCADQCPAGLDIDIAVVAQQHGLWLDRAGFECLEDVSAMTRCDVQDAHRHAALRYLIHRRAHKL